MKKCNFLKKLAAVCLCALALLPLTACGGKGAETESVTLNILEMNNDPFRNFTQTVRNSDPGISLNVERYSGSNGSGYIKQRIMSEDTPDIIYLTVSLTAEEQQEYLLDLSGYDFVDNYNLSLINQRDVDGKLYSLPANYSIISMLYNKTLFAEKGWEVPKTHNELVALCRQIRTEEPDIIPITHAGSMPGTYWRIVSAIEQSGYLSTSEGLEWQKKYVKGEATFEEGFGDTINKLQALIDAGAFAEADKGIKNNDVSDNLLNRKAAMAFPIGGLGYLNKNLKNCKDEIGGFPYLGDTPEKQFVNVSANGVALSKKLSEPGNEKKLEAALKFLEYYSTEEGQQLMNMAATDVSPLAGSTPSDEFPPYNDVINVVNSGSAAPYLLEGYEDIWVETGTYVMNKIFTGGNLDGLCEEMDKLHKASLNNNTPPVATIPKDLTHTQTVQLMADLLHNAGGDVAIVSDGGVIDGVANPNGVSGRLFKGELNHDTYNTCIPGNLEKNLAKLTLTGEQLFRLLENGRTMTSKDKTAVFDYYWSGMDAVIENGKITSATLSDGTPIKSDGKYEVIISSVDYDSATYTGAVDTGKTIKDAYLEYMTGKTLTAPKKLCR